MEEYHWCSSLEIVDGVKSKEISPLEILNCYLNRIKNVNPQINAIITLTEEIAWSQAKKAEEDLYNGKPVGPLHGVPVTLKDNIFTMGIKTTFGSKLYENFIPDQDAVLVKRLKRAGAIILGKTNMPEFGLLPITDNMLFGSTQNPWDYNKTSGGSSGGSAAGVAAGFCPVSIANDTGGSIRIPASLCGVYGLKPSLGRIPSYPRRPGWYTLYHEGPITRRVADAALIMNVIAGSDEGDRLSLPVPPEDYLSELKKGVKGFSAAYSHDLGFAVVEPEIKEITYKAALAFEELGCKVEEIKLDLPDMLSALERISVINVIVANEQQLNEWKEVACPAYQYIFDKIFEIDQKDIIRDEFVREQILWDKIRKIFDKYDLLLTPASAIAAFDSGRGGPIGPTVIDNKEVSEFSWTSLADLFNFTGQPAASVPCGFTNEGLPVGLQIVGRRYSDLTVLQASAALEEALSLNIKCP